MSTYYYNLKPPIGSVQRKQHIGGIHEEVTLYDTTGAMLGTLIFRIDDDDEGGVNAFVRSLCEKNPACQQYAAGGGRVGYHKFKELKSRVLVADHNELVRAEVLRERMGRTGA